MSHKKAIIKLTYNDLKEDITQLEKYIRKKCRFETKYGKIIEDAEIGRYKKDRDTHWSICLFHNGAIASRIEDLTGKYKKAYVLDNIRGEFNGEVKWIEVLEEEKFKEGERILVRDEENEKWVKRIFLYKDKSGYFITVNNGDEKRYLRGEEYGTCIWKQGKKIDTIKIKTVDGKIVEIEEDKLEKLGFKFVTN